MGIVLPFCLFGMLLQEGNGVWSSAVCAGNGDSERWFLDVRPKGTSTFACADVMEGFCLMLLAA